MKLANICPIDFLEPVLGNDPGEDYHLILAEQVLESGVYLDFYRRRLRQGDFIIFDNGAHEYKTSQHVKYLMEALVQFFGDLSWNFHSSQFEVVLPDTEEVPRCAPETLRLSRYGADYLNTAMPGLRYMVVPHGRTLEEFLNCAKELLEIPNVVSVGISDDESLRVCDGDRELLARRLKPFGKDIHYLGILEDLHDLWSPWAQRNVRGVDGCKFVRWGIDGKFVNPLTPAPPYPGRGGKGYFDLKWGDLQPDTQRTVKENVAIWRYVCAGEVSKLDLPQRLTRKEASQRTPKNPPVLGQTDESANSDTR